MRAGLVILAQRFCFVKSGLAVEGGREGGSMEVCGGVVDNGFPTDPVQGGHTLLLTRSYEKAPYP